MIRLTKLHYLVFILMVLPFSVSAAPSINSVSGSLDDGNEVTINGSSFGSKANKVEWLGGTKGHIESANAGSRFSRSGWATDSTSGNRQTPEYTSAKAHSGSKSVKAFWPQQSQYTSGMSYNNGGSMGSVYMTWWLYFDHVNSAAQFKMFRLMDRDGYTDADGTFYYNQW